MGSLAISSYITGAYTGVTGAVSSTLSPVLGPIASKVAACAVAIFSSTIFQYTLIVIGALLCIGIATSVIFSNENYDIPPELSSGQPPQGELAPGPGTAPPVPPLREPRRPRKFTPIEGPLPPPPAEGIKAGCVNINNSCWLNSAMNALSGNPDFADGLLNLEMPAPAAGENPAITNLRSVLPPLKIAINRLRTGKAIRTNLATEIRQQVHACGYIGVGANIVAQHDPKEFLENLIGDWNIYYRNFNTEENPLPAPPLPYQTVDYKAMGGHAGVRERDHRVEMMYVRVMASDEERNDPTLEINLDKGSRDMEWNDYDDDLGQGEGNRRRYYRKIKIDTERSNFLMVNFDRAVANQGGENQRRLQNPVAIDHDGTVTINKQKYRVKGAVFHQGHGVDGGHWYYIEAHENGHFYEHNDERVYEVSAKNGSLREGGISKLKKATTFFLQKVVAPEPA